MKVDVNTKITLATVIAILVSVASSYMLITPREGPQGEPGLAFIPTTPTLQTINFTIAPGHMERYQFHLPGGAIWIAQITLSHDYCSIAFSWSKGDVQTFIGSSGRDLNQYGIEGVALSGVITCEHFNSKDPSLYVTCSVITQYPEIQRASDGWIT